MSWSQHFELQTKLPVKVIESKKIKIDADIRAQLSRDRLQYDQNTLVFNHDTIAITNSFISSTPASFECIITYNMIGFEYPKLTAGIKMPDEYYFDLTTKNAFIIEKKVQTVSGSVDEKIQAAAFKQFILRKKFNSD